MKTLKKVVVGLLRETISGWSLSHVRRLAAALAFYSVLSLAPLLVIAVAILGFVFGEDAARGQIAAQISHVVGAAAGEVIETVLSQARAPEQGLWGSLLGVVVLLYGASGVFGELQAALNTVWNVAPKPGGGVLALLRERFVSFSMVMGVLLLLLASVVVSAFLSAAGAVLQSSLPGGSALWEIASFLLSLVLTALLTALIFKVVPDIEIDWAHVLPGACLTSLLFSVGRYLLGLYLARASVASPYGAAGSVVVLVIWVYYAAQILLFGAEFTRVCARARGAPVVPSKNATFVAEVALVRGPEAGAKASPVGARP